MRHTLIPPIAMEEHKIFEDAGHGYHYFVIPVEDVNKLVVNAIRYAKRLCGQIVAMHILLSSGDRSGIEDQWRLHNIDIPLLIVESPEDSVLEPFKEFVDGLLKRNKGNIVTILLPVITGLKWRQRFLHNQTARLIERTFQNKAGVVTARVPFSITQTLTVSCKIGKKGYYLHNNGGLGKKVTFLTKKRVKPWTWFI